MSLLPTDTRFLSGDHLAPKSILLVEDEPTVRLVMKRVLAGRGYAVDEAVDGRAALAMVRTTAYDLVITDLVMPELEGLEVIRALRREAPALAVLAVSGAYGGAFLHAAELLGARATLAKPFDPDTLVSVVEGLVGVPC